MDRRLCELQAEICQIFAHPKRIELLNLLRDGEKSVGALVTEMGIAKANVSQHLGVLRERGVVSVRRKGQMVYYRVANPKIFRACELMRQVLLEGLSEGRLIAARAAGQAARSAKKR